LRKSDNNSFWALRKYVSCLFPGIFQIFSLEDKISDWFSNKFASRIRSLRPVWDVKRCSFNEQDDTTVDQPRINYLSENHGEFRHFIFHNFVLHISGSIAFGILSPCNAGCITDN
jgi:hypothetical protein